MSYYDQNNELWVAFDTVLRADPQLWTLMKRYTLEMIETGRTRYSCRTIFHRIRWDVDMSTSDETFKVNNNWTPYFSRVFMWAYPQHGPSCWRGVEKQRPWGVNKPLVNDGFFTLREVDTNFEVEKRIWTWCKNDLGGRR